MLLQARYWSCLRGLLPQPAPQLPPLHVPAAVVAAAGFRAGFAPPAAHGAAPRSESAEDEDMLPALPDGAHGGSRHHGQGGGGHGRSHPDGIGSPRSNGLASPRSHPHGNGHVHHSHRHGGGSHGHGHQHSGPGGHGHGHSGHDHSHGHNHGSQHGDPAARGDGGDRATAAPLSPRSPRQHSIGNGNGGARRTKLAFRGNQGRSARRWHLVRDFLPDEDLRPLSVQMCECDCAVALSTMPDCLGHQKHRGLQSDMPGRVPGAAAWMAC